MDNQEPTNKKILQAVSGVDQRIDKVGQRIEKVKSTNNEIIRVIVDLGQRIEKVENANNNILSTVNDTLSAVNDFATKTENRFQGLEQRVGRIEALMVTKDYLDDKLADLRGDLVVLMRKEDTKLRTLVDVLKKREIISKDDAQYILSLEPFPQLSL